jgi:hypothetical protein
MNQYFDIETDGLNPKRVWCAGIENENGEYTELLHPTSFPYNEEDTYYAHNGIGFDYPINHRLLGAPTRRENQLDTLVLSRLASPSRSGGHALESWGERLNFPKGDHSDWSQLSDDMRRYMRRDVELVRAVHKAVTKELQGFSEESIQLEHEVAWIIQDQMNNGWLLDQEKCWDLLAELKEKKFELEDEVREVFRPYAQPVKEITPKYKKDGTLSVVGLKWYGERALQDIAGPCTRIDFPEFNLGSRQQIGAYLQRFGWVPTKFTETGQPVVSEEELEGVTDIPQAQLIAKYLTVTKRIAQIQSWLEAVEDQPDGRVRGYVNSNGAVTGRMTHSAPNMAQVPASYSWYGPECRSCWIVEDGKVLVGCDADGLELCMLAHYMNDPEYIKAIVEGDKNEGTDIHSINQRAAGLETRDIAKTFIYAFLYGAGDAKIGSIIGGTAADGKRLKQKFLRNTPALKALRKRVTEAARRGWLQGLDGRRLQVRSSHAALNTLLQGAGAVIMKRALVIMDQCARQSKLEYRFVGNIHDEVQAEVLRAHAERFGRIASASIVAAGQYYNLRCPLAGSHQIGPDWSQTH